MTGEDGLAVLPPAFPRRLAMGLAFRIGGTATRLRG